MTDSTFDILETPLTSSSPSFSPGDVLDLPIQEDHNNPTLIESSIQVGENETSHSDDDDAAINHSDRNHLGTSVFDSRVMAPLSQKSIQVLARLRAYKPPPFATWNKLPLSRRAAVLILLFADRRGDLRVVITMRATSMRNYSGHAAFPGGKADTLEETPFEIARREASEEIGLPQDDEKLPRPFRIEHLCQLPFNMAKTELAVRPCVAFLHADDGSRQNEVTVGEALIPRLEAAEVAAVFSAPLHNFLRAEDEVLGGVSTPGKKSDWYQGTWTDWHGGKWRMHSFYVPITNQRVTKPRSKDLDQTATVEKPNKEEEDGLSRYRVWGMTARIVVDTARLAYDEEPEFEHNAHIGDERMIEKLEKMGRLSEAKKPGSFLTREDLEAASKM